MLFKFDDDKVNTNFDTKNKKLEYDQMYWNFKNML